MKTILKSVKRFFFMTIFVVSLVISIGSLLAFVISDPQLIVAALSGFSAIVCYWELKKRCKL
jgi:hypothetical protein